MSRPTPRGQRRTFYLPEGPENDKFKTIEGKFINDSTRRAVEILLKHFQEDVRVITTVVPVSTYEELQRRAEAQGRRVEGVVADALVRATGT